MGHTVAAPVVRTVAAPVVRTVATPVVSSYAHSVATPLVSSIYGGHYYGKREAEPYTIGQVYAGLPYANAYATGHAHNVGYTTGYTGFPYAAGSAGHFYG